MIRVGSAMGVDYLRRSTQDQGTLLDRTSGSDSDQSLSGTAGKHNDTRSRSTISEHFGQRRFLVWSDDGHGFELDI